MCGAKIYVQSASILYKRALKAGPRNGDQTNPSPMVPRLALRDLSDGVDGHVNLVGRGKPAGGEAHDALALGAERAVHERGAVGAGARRDVPAVHEGVRDLGGVQARDVQRHDARARARLAQLQRRPVAVDGDAGHVCHALVQAPRHGELMLPHGRHAAVLGNKAQAGGQARKPVAVERAGLKARGPPERLLLVKAMDARAAHVPRGHVHARHHGGAARALRPHERLVARETHDVQALLGHVDGDETRRLGRVHHAQGPGRVGNARNRRHVNDVSRDVGGRRHHDGTRARRHEPGELVHVQAPQRVAPRVGHGDAALGGKAVERPQHRVVLEHRGDHAVAGAHDAVDDAVERLGRVGGKRHVVRARTAEKARHALAALVDHARRAHGARARAAPSVAERAHRPHDGVDDRLRLAHRRRGVVQVDHGILQAWNRCPPRSSETRGLSPCLTSVPLSHLTNSSISMTSAPSTATPASVRAETSASRSCGAAFQASPQPALICPGTGIMRPGSPACPHSSSHAMAAAVVGNVSTSAGLRTRGMPTASRRPRRPRASRR